MDVLYLVKERCARLDLQIKAWRIQGQIDRTCRKYSLCRRAVSDFAKDPIKTAVFREIQEGLISDDPAVRQAAKAKQRDLTPLEHLAAAQWGVNVIRARLSENSSRNQ